MKKFDTNWNGEGDDILVEPLRSNELSSYQRVGGDFSTQSNRTEILKNPNIEIEPVFFGNVEIHLIRL